MGFKFRLAMMIIVASIFSACNRIAPQQEVHNILTERMATLSTAESCTGGVIASRFTAIPGASAYFRCGFVVYDVSSKSDILGIDMVDISHHGTVSEAIVRLMAENALKIGKADYSIATTGVAGPTGGTAENPVGSVWIAVATPDKTISKKIFTTGDRKDVINYASEQAIQLLLDELKRNK